MTRRDPINPTDEAARSLGRRLLGAARHGALAVTDPDGGPPLVSRVAVAAADGAPLILISDLSLHAGALRADPGCSILLGEPAEKGDPLAHPRMTVVARAEPLDKTAWRDHWLARHPGAKLYYDFADFRMVRLVPAAVHLNGGFGRAYRLAPQDLLPLPHG